MSSDRRGYSRLSQNPDIDTIDRDDALEEKKPLSEESKGGAVIPLDILSRNDQSQNAQTEIDLNTDDLGLNPYTQPLKYLYMFSEKETQELEDRYSRSRYELDDLIVQHKWVYRATRAENWYSIGTDVSYSLFQIVTSRDGIQSLANLINKDIHVSDTAGIVAGTPIALVDLAFNMSAVSAAKEAIKATLEYATRDSYRNQARDFLAKAKTHPGQATGTIVKWAFNKSVLYTHNLIGASANIIAFYEPIAFSLPNIGEVVIPAWMPMLPSGAQLGIAAGFAYGGNRYYSLFSNPDYYENFDKFWMQGFKDLWNRSPEGSPWLLGELFRSKVATPLQVAIQGLVSTVAIRAYPNFYYLADEIFNQLLGVDPSITPTLAASVAVVVAWHTLCARYPKTYNRYMEDQIKIEIRLRRDLEAAVETEVSRIIDKQIDDLKLAMVPGTIQQLKKKLHDQIMNSFIAANIELRQKQIMETEGRLYPLRKDPALKYQLLYRFLVGAYLGFNTIAPALKSNDEASSLAVLRITFSMALGANLLAGALYKAEKNRITDHLILQKLEAEIVEAEEAATQGSMLGNRVADSITIGSNVSRALSVLGSAKRVFGNDNEAATAGVAIIAAENMINSILFALEKVRSTVNGWSCFRGRNSAPARVANVQGTLFAARSPANAPSLRADNGLTLTDERREANGWRSWLPRLSRKR